LVPLEPIESPLPHQPHPNQGEGIYRIDIGPLYKNIFPDVSVFNTAWRREGEEVVNSERQISKYLAFNPTKTFQDE
jgi:hypothetical protein